MSVNDLPAWGVLVTGKVPKARSLSRMEEKQEHVRIYAEDRPGAIQGALEAFRRKYFGADKIKAHYSYSLEIEATTLTPQEAKEGRFAVYNGCPHVCLEAPPDQTMTVSIKLPGGMLLTASVLPGQAGKGYTECVDIQLHGTGREWDNNGTKIPEFQTFQFRRGKIVADTRKEDMATTVVVLTNPEYYKK